MPDTAKDRRPPELAAASPLTENGSYLEALYETYLNAPRAVDPAWRNYFDGLRRADGPLSEVSHAPVRAAFRRYARMGAPATAQVSEQRERSPDHERKQIRVLQLINAYRVRGHQRAHLDPLDIDRRPPAP